ncbi:MAG: toprim domain-containing protein, partial [Planctomycetota bacterium]
RHDVVCGLRGTPNKEQLAALAERRRGKRTFLAFDADDAGRDLTWTLWEALAGPDYDVRVVAWGEEHDDDAERTPDTSPAPEAETTAT